MSQIIFGFTGLIASGKGSAVAYLEKKYEASTFRFSTMLRDTLDRFYLPHTRDNLVIISEILRQNFGEDLMAKTIRQDVEKKANSLTVVEGIRRLADITELKKLPYFILVEIFADPQTRFERLTGRTENADDQSKTFEQFIKDHERSTEKSIAEVVIHATERIDNNGDETALHRQLDALIKKYAN